MRKATLVLLLAVFTLFTSCNPTEVSYIVDVEE